MSEIESPLNQLFELLVTILITEPKTIAKLLKISVVFKKPLHSLRQVRKLSAEVKEMISPSENDFACKRKPFRNNNQKNHKTL